MQRRFGSIGRWTIAGVLVLLSMIGGSARGAQIPGTQERPDFYERMRVENPFSEGGNGEARIAAYEQWLEEQKPLEAVEGETEVERLRRQRFNARFEEYRIKFEMIGSGIARVDELSKDLTNSTLALARTDEERLAVLERGVGAALLIERILVDRFEVGVVETADLAAAIGHRLDREIELQEERVRQEAARQNDPGNASPEKQEASAPVQAPGAGRDGSESLRQVEVMAREGLRSGRKLCGPLMSRPIPFARFGPIGVRGAGMLLGLVTAVTQEPSPAVRGGLRNAASLVDDPFAEGGNGDARVAAADRWLEGQTPRDAVAGETDRQRLLRERFNVQLTRYRIVLEQVNGGVRTLDDLDHGLFEAALPLAVTDAERLEVLEAAVGFSLKLERTRRGRVATGGAGTEELAGAIAHRLDREIALIEEQERQAQRAKE
ncbi:MAG TPA: hypothetical protein DCQ98_14485 [Planctomycetaceae bacterium]|nr:hypothetical protein [Planctomycetaceae bacterium]